MKFLTVLSSLLSKISTVTSHLNPMPSAAKVAVLQGPAAAAAWPTPVEELGGTTSAMGREDLCKFRVLHNIYTTLTQKKRTPNHLHKRQLILLCNCCVTVV